MDDVTDAQREAIFAALDELDDEERTQLLKGARELVTFAKANGITVEELCRTASTREQ